MNSQVVAFAHGRPFFEMVTSFLAATIGLGPVFEPSNPLNLGPGTIAWYRGQVLPNITIDMGQVHNQCVAGALTADAAVKALCCMLLNSAYTAAEPHNDRSAEFEAFRHLRNAASHGNRFSFFAHEPARPASWRGLVIDHHKKGSNTRCTGWNASVA